MKQSSFFFYCHLSVVRGWCLSGWSRDAATASHPRSSHWPGAWQTVGEGLPVPPHLAERLMAAVNGWHCELRPRNGDKFNWPHRLREVGGDTRHRGQRCLQIRQQIQRRDWIKNLNIFKQVIKGKKHHSSWETEKNNWRFYQNLVSFGLDLSTELWLSRDAPVCGPRSSGPAVMAHFHSVSSSILFSSEVHAVPASILLASC